MTQAPPPPSRQTFEEVKRFRPHWDVRNFASLNDEKYRNHNRTKYFCAIDGDSVGSNSSICKENGSEGRTAFDQRGHVQDIFNAMNDGARHHAVLQLLTELEICARARLFVGTFSRLLYILVLTT